LAGLEFRGVLCLARLEKSWRVLKEQEGNDEKPCR